MPTATDLPDGFSITSSCPGELCSAESELPNASVLAESDAEDAADFVAVGATEYPDAEAAAASLASSRSTREAETGPFETPVQDREDGYTPGRTGEGTLEDAAVDDWTGYRHIATYQTIHPDTGMSDEVRTEGHLVLARGTTMISVQLLNEGSDVAGVEAQLDERIRSLIAALP